MWYFFTSWFNHCCPVKFQSSKGLKSSSWTGKFQFGGFSRIFRSSDRTSNNDWFCISVSLWQPVYQIISSRRTPKLGMQFDCTFVLAIICPVITGKTQVYRGAVDGIKRILKLKFMFGGNCHQTFLRFFQNDIGEWSWKAENIWYFNTSLGILGLNIKDLGVFNI